jgi:hypothetical protein
MGRQLYVDWKLNQIYRNYFLSYYVGTCQCEEIREQRNELLSNCTCENNYLCACLADLPELNKDQDKKDLEKAHAELCEALGFIRKKDCDGLKNCGVVSLQQLENDGVEYIIKEICGALMVLSATIYNEGGLSDIEYH